MTTERRHPSIVPALRYADAPKAIDWLCEAFGFTRHLVVPGEGDTIAHAQLTLGRGMIMLGSGGQHRSEYDERIVVPAERGGTNSQSAYVIIADVDAHHDRARAAGAEIIMPPTDQEYGGRDYTCADCEGHVWTFGSYDPWAE